MHDAPTPKDEPVGWVVRPSGAVPSVIWLIRRLVRRVPRPVIALPGRDLYQVLICGRGFALPVEGERGEPTGFFTTRFVAARSRQDAESIALSRVRKDWSGWSLLSHLTGVEEPQLAVDETEAWWSAFAFGEAPATSSFGTRPNQAAPTRRLTRR